jgi:hypothetical protein
LELVRVVVEYLSFTRDSCVERERKKTNFPPVSKREREREREREKAVAALTALLIVV